MFQDYNSHESGDNDIGCAVELCGLKSRSDLNGKRGIVLSGKNARGRHPVAIINGEDYCNPNVLPGNVKVSVKPANFKVFLHFFRFVFCITNIWQIIS